MKFFQKGVIHLFLLVTIFIAALAIILVVILFKPDLSSYVRMDDSSEKVTTTVTPTVTTTEVSDLEKEVNADQISDPSSDFSEVDQDINSL